MSNAAAPMSYGSTSTPQLAKSSSAGPRIDSLDLLRGIAILGIFLMNTWTMSLPQDTYTNPATYNPHWIPYMGFPVNNADGTITYTSMEPLTGINHWVYVVIHLFADMKFITTFSMLFGAGIVLQAERSRKKGNNPWTTHYLRMSVLLCFGLIHTFGFWYGDILTDYALCGFILAPLRLLPTWLLFLVGIFMVWIPTGMEISREHHEQNIVAAVRAGQDPDDVKPTAFYSMMHTVETFEGKIWTKSTDVSNQDLKDKGYDPNDFVNDNDRQLIAYHGSWWGEIVDHRFWCSIIDHTTGFITWTFWRCGGCFLIGMALQKRRFFHGAWPMGAYATIASFTIPVGWTLSYVGVLFNQHNGWSESFDTPFSVYRMGSLFNYWGSLLCSFGYMSTGVLLAILAASALPAKKPWALWGMQFQDSPVGFLLHNLPLQQIYRACLVPFRSIGRMALTCYLTETLIGTTVYYCHRIGSQNLGLGYFGKTTRLENLWVVFPTWIFLMVFAPLWLTVFRQGPLEWFWHSLVYWDWKNPLKSAAGPDASLSPSVAGSAGDV